jgi:hypothetical protein
LEVEAVVGDRGAVQLGDPQGGAGQDESNQAHVGPNQPLDFTSGQHPVAGLGLREARGQLEPRPTDETVGAQQGAKGGAVAVAAAGAEGEQGAAGFYGTPRVRQVRVEDLDEPPSPGDRAGVVLLAGPEVLLRDGDEVREVH